MNTLTDEMKVKNEVGMKSIVALLAGSLFGMGLAVSGMTDKAVVLGFLDIFGEWDYRLALVMAGGLAVAIPAYRFTTSRKPLFDKQWHLPTAKHIDMPLLMGALFFGIGWGLYGYCPGPAISSLAYGQLESVFFILAMIGGMASAKAITKNHGARVAHSTQDQGKG